MSDFLKGLPKKIAESLIVRGVGAVLIAAGLAIFLVLRKGEAIAVSPVLVVAGAAALLGLSIAALLLWRGRRKYLAYHGLDVGYSDVVYQALETLQRNVTNPSEVNLDQVIEKGILQPVRDLLKAATGAEDIRLSILVLENGSEWKMPFQAGHHLDSQYAFSLAYDRSFSRFAYESKEIEWSDNLEADPRFAAHPEARPGREYCAIASVPLLLEGEADAVWNVVSTEPEVFDGRELFYIKLVGSILNLAWGLRATGSGGASSWDLS